MTKFINIVMTLSLAMTAFSCFSMDTQAFQHPFYAGISGGFGSTTWRGLIPINQKESAVLNISTPVQVNEGGATWGIVMGYDFSPYFALEGAYRNYPSARITFEEQSLYAFEHDDELTFKSNTDTLSLMAKVMLVIPNSSIRFFSSIGAAAVHRLDEDFEYFQLAPTFGAGFNISLTERFIVEFGLNYTAGYGESEISPAKHYIPFLYSGMVNLAYRF